MRYLSIREEEIKNKITQDYFWNYDCSKIIGNVDFCVCMWQSMKDSTESESLLWAEAKRGASDIYKSIAQLILTIGKARTFANNLPPHFIGAFDGEKIAFVPYSDIQEIFYQNDFNWKVAASDYSTKEFQTILEKVRNSIDNKSFLFYYDKDDRELKKFIKTNFVVGKFGVCKLQIDKTNFIHIYNKWLETVKPTIQVDDWTLAKNNGIMDGDFFLADLLSAENKTLKEKLIVLLKTDLYELNLNIPNINMSLFARMGFSDNQKAHEQFWTKYERPPLEEYWDFFVDNRHLLVPQDIRERKGSFYTPKIWVELSQKYLADVFGKDWQEEYYVWDCAAGTGNLLAGLTNKYNIWASTLDKADVDVMKDRIQNGANLLESHVFQFDFLNDDFSKLPKGLQNIINDPEERKRLIIYINPPYAEATSTAARIGTKENKTGVATGNKIHIKYSDKLGKARNELFAQFLTRIYFEISGCKIGEFSTQKALIAPNFKDFRKFFLAKLKKCFIVPANTFDNVKGKFPIGFKVWDTEEGKHFINATVDVYDAKGVYFGKKTYRDGPDCEYVNDWIKNYRDKDNNVCAKLCFVGNDFQNSNKVQICSPSKEVIAHDVVFGITQKNLIAASVYFSVRKCVEATWLNDRDQFLYPKDGWEKDEEFQNNCLTYTIFHNNNHISTKHGVNHWIPFMEEEIDAKDTFESHIMVRFITGKKIPNRYSNLFESEEDRPNKKIEFSAEAKKVFDAGRELWRYYHKQPKCNVNASLYDIREYFQERNEKGKMNNKSDDEKYNGMIDNLRSTLKILAKKIEPKVYEYGFLK